MTKTIFKLRNVATIVACLAVTTMFSGCDPTEDDPTIEGTPAAVENLTATAGNAQVGLTWNEPADNGGAEITAYEVTANNWADKVTKTASELSHTFTGLTNGTEYTFKVRAVNAKGAGRESEAKATPQAGGTTTLGTWTEVENTTFGNVSTTQIPVIYSVAYGDGKFVAVGHSGGSERTQKMAYSTDGVNWTAVTNTGFTPVPLCADGDNVIRDVAYGNGKFVAVGSNNKLAYSTDGINWTAVATKPFLQGVNVLGTDRTNISCITYGNGKFIIGGQRTHPHPNSQTDPVGAQMAYSTDGINWTAIDATMFGFGTFVDNGSTIRALAYENGKFFASSGYPTYCNAYSTDGINWTNIVFPTGLNNFATIAYGNGKFIAGQDIYRGRAYSTDGINWTQTAEAFETKDIIYANGKFVAVGMSSNIWYSADGLNWTNTHAFDYTYGGAGSFYKIAYGGGKFVVVGCISTNKPFIAYCND